MQCSGTVTGVFKGVFKNPYEEVTTISPISQGKKLRHERRACLRLRSWEEPDLKMYMRAPEVTHLTPGLPGQEARGHEFKPRGPSTVQLGDFCKSRPL